MREKWRQQEGEGEKKRHRYFSYMTNGPIYYSPHIPPSHKVHFWSLINTLSGTFFTITTAWLHWLTSSSLSTGTWFSRKFSLNLPSPIIRHADSMQTLLWHLCIKINFFFPTRLQYFWYSLLLMQYTQDSFLTQITQFICNILSLICFPTFNFPCVTGLIYMRFWFLISKAKELD